VNVRASGRVLGGRYRLLREIASGGMATVWEAHDEVLDRRVAVKLLHPQFASDPEFVERFRREARAAAALSHPNIVAIFDVGEDAETHVPFLVMELVDGGNLKDRIRQAAPLAETEIRSIGAALAATLEYAHRKGIVHRDVKPQNVLLGADGRPRLTDFGIAQAMSSKGLTRTGMVMGSVHYLAPEVVRGQPAVPQSDVYGLGAVLYEMATGRVPFDADTDLAVAVAHVEQIPAAPRALNAGLSPGLERTIMRALAKSTDTRYPTAAALAADLRAADAATAATARIGFPPPSPSRVPPRTTATSGVLQRPVQVPSRSAAPTARRTARPQPRGRGASGGVVVLLLALAAVLVALGAGFFGLATLSREGLQSADPTATPAPRASVTAAPTARPAMVPSASATATAVPARTAAPSPTTQPTLPPTLAPTIAPTVAPTPSPPPPTPTPPPQPSPAPVTVALPSLVGMTLDQAQAALKNAGLTLTVRGVNVNANKDVVVETDPDAGTRLPPGATVTVMVGTGSTAVPNVANMASDQAIRALQNSSFHVTIRQRRDQNIPAGVAIETSPAAGTVLTRNSEVILTVSSGR
jgi:serine/threonine-protein kinase